MCNCSYNERNREVKENIKFLLDSYKSKKWEGLLMTFAILEICQLNEDINFDEAKEIMYRYLESIINPDDDCE